MNIHKRIKDRINWFSELYKEIIREVKDEEIAKVIFKTIMFEENYQK